MKRFLYCIMVVGLVAGLVLGCAPRQEPTPVAAPKSVATSTPVFAPERVLTSTPAPAAKSVLTPKPTTEQAGTPYYQGKTITFFGGFSPGGAFDIAVRLLSSLMPKHLPGNPKFVVQSKQGAGGVVSANLFNERQKPDGMTLYFLQKGPAVQQQAGLEIVQYDLRKWKMIGSVLQPGSNLMVRKDALPRLTDPKAKALVVGSLESRSSWMSMPIWGREHLGWNVRFIMGFGKDEVILALRRGEIDMTGVSGYNRINPLIQEGVTVSIAQEGLRVGDKYVREPASKDVPTFTELMGDKLTGLAADGYLAWVGVNFATPAIMVAGNTPDNLVNILRDAFLKATEEPQFQSDYKRLVTEYFVVVPAEQAMKGLVDYLNLPRESVNYGNELVRKFNIE